MSSGSHVNNTRYSIRLRTRGRSGVAIRIKSWNRYIGPPGTIENPSTTEDPVSRISRFRFCMSSALICQVCDLVVPYTLWGGYHHITAVAWDRECTNRDVSG